MARSNWRGTSGWGAIDDPTGVLSGRVLVASAGATSSAEDYLSSEVGSEVSWSKKHYRVQFAYGWPGSSSPHPMEDGSFAVIARAGNFTGTPADARDGYVGEIDVDSGIASIIRRNADVSTVLVTSALEAEAYTLGERHTLALDCYAGQTNAVTLSLLVDGTSVASVGDDAQNRLLSGEPGLRSASGTVYVDDFQVFEYTEDGGTPAAFGPENVSELRAWWKGDAGLTLAGSSVSTWADQTSNGNDAAQATASRQPQRIEDGLNSLDVVSFVSAAGTTQILAAPHDATIDLASSGASIFVVAYTGLTNAGGTFIRKGDQFKVRSVRSGSDNVLRFEGTSTVTGAGGTTAFDASHYSIFEVITDKDNAGTGFLGVNGNAALTFANVGVAVDALPNTNLEIGSDDVDSIEGRIAEVLVYGAEVSDGDRQRIEGYLANKWGTQIYLPDGHPYRDAAPTV